MKEKNTFVKILTLFIPIFLELFLINLLTSIDTLMLSRYNELCVDAVGTANSTLSLLAILLIISSNGVSITVGQFLGAKKNEDARKVLAQGALFNFILGFLLMLVFFFGNGALLKLANTPDSFLEYAKTYLRIYAIALPFMAITQVINANFRAYGKPFYMTIVSIVSNLINVGLNYVLIFGVGIFPELGITGAAIATTVSLIFKTICGLILNACTLKCEIIPRRVDFRILGGIIKIGGPSALESSVYSLAQFILLAALNRLSDAEITSRIYINLAIGYVLMFSSALNGANGILVARHVGAGEYQEAKWLTLKVAAVGLCIVITLVGLLNIFAGPIFTLIAGDDHLVPIIRKALPIVFILESGRCINLVVIGAQKASGDVIFPLILAVICMMAIHAGGAWLFTAGFHLGLSGILLAQGLDEFVRAIVSLTRWFSGKWMHHSLIKEAPKEEAEVCEA